MTSTQRDLPGPVEGREYKSDVKIIQDGDKLKMDINNHQLGQFTPDVRLNDDGIGYDQPRPQGQHALPPRRQEVPVPRVSQKGLVDCLGDGGVGSASAI